MARYLLDPKGFGQEILRHISELLSALLGPALLIAAFLLAACCAVLLFRHLRDRRLTQGARVLRILPPPEVDPDGALSLWMGLHALLRPAWLRAISGQPHIAWEVSTEQQDAAIYLWVAKGVPPGLIDRAVESSWPGARVQEVEAVDPITSAGSTSMCELVLSEPDQFPLGEGVGSDPLRLVLGSLNLLDPDEKAIIQILARPATVAGRYRLRSDALRLRRDQNLRVLGRPQRTNSARITDPAIDGDVRLVLAKASSPLWRVSLRIAVSSPKRASARGKIHAIAGAFAVFEGRNGFRRRHLRGGDKAINSRAMKRGYLLSVPELASIATLPSLEALPNLDRARAKTVAPPRGLPTAGKRLGLSDHSGFARPVALSVEDANHHVHLVGETGTGKSTLIARLVLEDAEAGRSAVVIDPKGDLVNAIIERLPKEAMDRTCILDPHDPQMAVGLNVLAGDDPDLVVDHIVSVFRRIYEGSWGPRSDDIMRAACLTLTQVPGATLAEIPLLLTNKEWRTAITSQKHLFTNIGDVGTFWDWYENLGEQQRSHNNAPLMNKLRAFLLRGPVRAIVGQSDPKLDIPSLLDSGGILLVRIPKGSLGEETSRLLGAFVVARVWQACMKRSEVAESSRHPVGLYVDEMHNYLALPRSFEDMLAEARAYGLSLVLAHQHMGQLPREMREALGANARTKIVFTCSPDDATVLSKHFHPQLSDHDLANLATYQAACKPCIAGGIGPAFTFATEPLAAVEPGRAEQVRAVAARHFGEERSAVEAEISYRHVRLKGGGRSGDRSGDQPGGQSGGRPSSAQVATRISAGDSPNG